VTGQGLVRLRPVQQNVEINNITAKSYVCAEVLSLQPKYCTKYIYAIKEAVINKAR